MARGGDCGALRVVDKGIFNLLEGGFLRPPQGALVTTAKQSWKFVWKQMMAELAPQSKTGAYERPIYTFQEKIGSVKHPDVSGRYQVYLGNPCPWCHRVQLVLNLRSISSDEVQVMKLKDDPEKATRGGWILSNSNQKERDLYQVYQRYAPGFTGRCTAPLLVDRQTGSIVSNESKDIVRMLELATFSEGTDRMELYPEHLKSTIDDITEWVYPMVNNGVYQCGFATTQQAYDVASKNVREGLERCNEILATQEFLCGNTFTEADLMLLPTMLRFDGAYVPLFHAGGAHLSTSRNYPYIYKWLQRCWSQVDGVSTSVDIQDACGSYFKQLFPLHPSGIVPTLVTAESLGLQEPL